MKLYINRVLNSNSDALSRITHIASLAQLDNQSDITYEKYKEYMRSKLITNTNVIETEGLLFETPENFALGHCVSADFIISQGIALKFRLNFGEI
jgi:hypothetical protein